ncbi:MAG: protein phosphatase 2C domain-containing protein [Terracidiphilus sp.]
MSISEAVTISFAGQCDRGKVREENQDTILQTTVPLGDLLMVADGIGGYEGGGVASRMAVEAISSSLADMPTFFPPGIALQEAASRANAEIAAAAAEPDTPNSHMGTTVVLALLQPDPGTPEAVQAWIGHAGDSRAYHLHHGRLSRVTRDHSAVQLLLDHNFIAPEEARNHPDASVLTRCLGHEPNVELEMDSVQLEPGDSLLLCSDGLWGYVEEEQIGRILADPALDTEAASRALLDLALDAGGHDNVGIQLARLGTSGTASPQPASRFKFEFALASQPELEIEPEPEPEIEAEPETALSSASALMMAAALEAAPQREPIAEAVPKFAPASPPPPAPKINPASQVALTIFSAPELPAAPEAHPELAPPAAAEAEFEPPPALTFQSPLESETEPVPARKSAFVLGSDRLESRISAFFENLAGLLVSFAFPLQHNSPFARARKSNFASRPERPESRIVILVKALASLMVVFASPLERDLEYDSAQEADFAPEFVDFDAQVSLFIRLMGILLVAFGTSCGLVYVALLQNWFGVVDILR